MASDPRAPITNVPWKSPPRSGADRSAPGRQVRGGGRTATRRGHRRRAHFSKLKVSRVHDGGVLVQVPPPTRTPRDIANSGSVRGAPSPCLIRSRCRRPLQAPWRVDTSSCTTVSGLHCYPGCPSAWSQTARAGSDIGRGRHHVADSVRQRRSRNDNGTTTCRATAQHISVANVVLASGARRTDGRQRRYARASRSGDHATTTPCPRSVGSRTASTTDPPTAHMMIGRCRASSWVATPPTRCGASRRSPPSSGCRSRPLYRWRHLRAGPPGRRVGRHIRYDPDDVRTWFRQLGHG